MIKRYIISVIFFLGWLPSLMATHFMGGEIMWECLPNGNYRFIMNLYRECRLGAATYGSTESIITNVPGLGNIVMNLYPDAITGRKDLSPQCNGNISFPHIVCPTPAPNQGGVEEWHYTSDEMYPNGVDLPAGPIPASGWYFAHTNCCRNPSVNIPTGESLGWYLRAIMYPYPSQSPDNCWDNSPSFSEKPSTVICAGYPFTYNPNGYDKELDSLSFRWDQPLTDSPAGAPITAYAGGYSYNSPLPGPAQNPNNVPATVNLYTGEISFTSYTIGAFVTVNKVTAYKCGVKIAEIFREMQIVLLNCSSNLPPEVTAPFQNPSTGLYTDYIDTVFAGSVVDFWMSALDTEYLNNGTDPQTLQILASGLQFGNGFISTSFGCLNPPCATLDPPPPAEGVAWTTTHFQWQTDCGHLATENPCGGITNIYNFILRVKDDYCPAPAYQWKTVTIVVKNPIMLPPRPRCSIVLEDGTVLLQFLPSDTSYYPNTWAAYYIYRADQPAGPYILIDSINYDTGGGVYFHNTTSYHDLAVNAQNNTYYYYFKTRSGCYGDYYSANSDTIQTTSVDVSSLGGGLAHLEWNTSHTPVFPTATGQYIVYRRTSSGNWIALDTTQTLSDELYVSGCGFIKFRIGAADSSGCESISAIDSALFQAAIPPRLQCTAVEPNGSVTLSYLPPADTGSLNYFSAYLVYYATNPAGPFLLIDSIPDHTLSSYTVNGVNANGQSLYFYMRNRINCDGFFPSGPSDTLRTIFLDVTHLTQTKSRLDWNETRIPPLSTASNTYFVYRKYPGNTWNLISQSSSLTLTDSVNLCGDSIPYRVETFDSAGCWSVSNMSKAYFYDDSVPPVPLMDTVSIDSISGNVYISWIANSPETIGYILLYFNGNIWQKFDTIMGNSNTSYIDKITPSDNCHNIKQYLVIAIDSCWNTSEMGLNDIHNTIKLQIVHVDPCEANVSLEWNPYLNMKDTLMGYRILLSENGGPWELLGLVTSPGPGSPVPTSFVHTGYTENSWYCYSVQAFNQDNTKTSTSCEVCTFAKKPKQPRFSYLRLATVEDNKYVRLNWYADTSAYVTQYRVYRSLLRGGPYDIVATVPKQYNPNMTYLDGSARFAYEPYYYYIGVVDSCDLEPMRSDTARTMQLTVISNDDFTNKIIWNDYEGWTWSYVNAYNLFRGIDGMLDPIPIAILPYGTTEFVDDVTKYIETQGKFRYFIEAVEGPGTLPFVDTSYSNVAGDVQRSLVFIPNAFSPKGYNSAFRPISSFVDKSDYYFMIYNRWGEMMFETNDPLEGWDGKFKGDYVPAGVYIYYVRFFTSEGQKFEKRSTVTVIK